MGPCWAWRMLADVVPDSPGAPLIRSNLTFYGAIGAAVVALLLLIGWLRRRSGDAEKRDPEAGLAEDLATYPPAPDHPAGGSLTLQGEPARLRLVVVAPVGRQTVAESGSVETLLDKVVRGLGSAARQDRARVREWPAGLSNAGFTPAFFRRVLRPEPAGTPSHWVLLAGPARAGGQKFFLGLALQVDDINKIGNMAIEDGRWNDVLRAAGPGA